MKSAGTWTGCETGKNHLSTLSKKCKSGSITTLGGVTVQFNKGQQIVYIPSHVLRQYKPSGKWELTDLLEHPETEFGFVTKTTGNQCFCRFWSKTDSFSELRTKGNSQLTPQANLFEYKLKSQDVIDELLENVR